MKNTKKTITIIGGGNMGEALIKGLHNNYNIYVVETNKQRASFLKKKYRVNLCELRVAPSSSSVIIFALKPQEMLTAIVAMKEECQKPKQNILYISIAAGLTTKFFETHLGGKPKVVRTMPNMPAMIGEGITAICAGRWATSIDVTLACVLLKTIGDTMVIKENMIDAVTAVSGSGPAYVFLFVEQWIAAALHLKLNRTEAKLLVVKTLLGSAHIIAQSQYDVSTLRSKVISKGGTTQAAMDVFTRHKFDNLITKAVSAAYKRAKELSK